MDNEDVHVDVEKTTDNLDNEPLQAVAQLPASPSTTKPLTPSHSTPVSTPEQQTPTTTSAVLTSADLKPNGKPSSTVTVLTPTKQHQKVFHTGTKRPVVVLRDIVGRPGKRKRSPRRGDSPKRGTRRVSLPMQQHPGFEPCVLAKAKVWLPIDVIEEPFIFNEVVSLDTWDSVLSDKDRERLSEFLPDFSDDDEKEKRESLRRLFAGDNFHFGNPADFLQKKIQSGRLHPNIIKADRLCHKQKFKEYKYKQQRRAHKLLKDVLISRQELLEAAQYTAPHEPIRVRKTRPKPVHQEFDDKVAKKYRRVLRDVRQECGDLDTSDDDEKNVLEVPAANTTKTWFDILSEMYPSHNSVTSIQATTAPKPPPFDVTNSPIMSPPASQTDSPKKLTEADFIAMLEKHQRRRKGDEDHFDLDTASVHLQDVVSRVYSLHRSPVPGAASFIPARTPTHKKKRKDKDKIKKKKRMKPPKVPKTHIPPPPPPPPQQQQQQQVVKVKTEPKMPLVEKQISSVKAPNQEAPSIKVEVSKPASLIPSTAQATQPTSVMTSGFFVLLKDFITSCPNQSISLQDLENKVAAWQRSPTSLLCGWLSLEPSWSKVTSHALRFLSGNIPSIVPVDPRVQYDLTTQVWTWIGEGKDSNDELVHLFKQWLQVLADETPIVEPVTESRSRRVVEEITNIPSPRMKTEYVVKPSTEGERLAFREQERKRYSQPQKAFTYYAHGYEAVVGPVKGVIGKESSLTKAREHSLLVSERPPYVTILSLVRDAVARLPNGEGTRSEVCELLKDSQFISLSMDSHLNTVVSGALDRLHYEKDPCVKYDTTRKIWIYLHRNRNEKDFERKLKEMAASSKAKRTTTRQRPATKLKSLTKDPQSSYLPPATSSSIIHETNDNITFSRRESPTPQAPMSSRLMTPAPMTPSPVPHHSLGQGAMPQIALSSPRQGLPVAAKQTIQQQLLNAQLLRSVLPMSGIQMTAIRTPTSDVATTSIAAPPLFGPDGKTDSAGTSLIKAQLLAPRVGHIPVGVHQYTSQQHQVMLSAEAAARGAQMNPADIRNQLLAQSLARSLTMPSAMPRPPMTSLGSAHQAQQIALSLAGARGKQPGQQVQPPNAADMLKQEMALQALQAGGAGIQPGTSSNSQVNVTLTLKRAQTMDEVAAAAVATQYSNIPRQTPQGVRLPTVGSLLAGLGMPHANAPIHTRPPAKKRNRSKKSSTLANLAKTHTIRTPMSTQAVTTQHLTQPGILSTLPAVAQTGQQTKVVTLQALSQVVTSTPVSVTTTPTRSTLSPAVTASSILKSTTPSTVSAATVMSTSSVTTTTQSMTTTAVTTSKPSTPARTAAVRRPSTPKAQKISKMISQPAAGKIPEVRYSLPTGRKTPPAATSHTAAIHRLALQSLTQQTPGSQKTTPKGSALHVLGDGKPAIATIPMSLLLQGQALASSGGLPKGALPVLSSQLLGNIPVGMAQGGKGLIFQMPAGSKLVTAVPVTTSATQSSSHSAATTTTATTTTVGEKKSLAQAATSSVIKSAPSDVTRTSPAMTKPTSTMSTRQRSPGRSPKSPVVASQQLVSKTLGSTSSISTRSSTGKSDSEEAKKESKAVPTTTANPKSTNA